jgi:hypothetical protein
MTMPNLKQLETASFIIDQNLDATFKQGVVVPEYVAVQEALKELRKGKALIPELRDKVEAAWPQVQKLANIAEMVQKAKFKRNAAILTFPSADGSKTVTTITYPYYIPRPGIANFFKNPLGYGSFAIKDACSEVAARMGLKFDSNYSGTDIKIRNKGGSSLSPEQKAAFFENLQLQLRNERIQVFTGELSAPKERAGLSGASVGLDAAAPPPLAPSAPALGLRLFNPAVDLAAPGVTTPGRASSVDSGRARSVDSGRDPSTPGPTTP